MNVVELFGKKYDVKLTLKSYALFEEISGYSIFELDKVKESLTMNLMFIYAVVKANHSAFMGWSDFVAAWDDVEDAFAQVGLIMGELKLAVDEMVAKSSKTVEDKFTEPDGKKK